MSLSEFSIKEEERDATSFHFTIEGKVAIVEATTLETHLKRAMEAGYNTITIDMGGISVFTSAGIRVVLKFYKDLKAQGRRFGIENPSENVRNVIGTVALEEMIVN